MVNSEELFGIRGFMKFYTRYLTNRCLYNGVEFTSL